MAKAALTRMTNRIAFGVCPCCHRHFDNLQRHIATKHPEFLKDSDKVSEPSDYVSDEEMLGIPQSGLITTYEAARLKNCTDVTVRNAIRRRRISAVMKGNKFYVSRKEVEKWTVGNYASRR